MFPLTPRLLRLSAPFTLTLPISPPSRPPPSVSKEFARDCQSWKFGTRPFAFKRSPKTCFLFYPRCCQSSHRCKAVSPRASFYPSFLFSEENAVPEFRGLEIQVGGTRLETYPNASDSGTGSAVLPRNPWVPNARQGGSGCEGLGFPTRLGP